MGMISGGAMAQKISYFDKDWQPTTRENAVYYRPQPEKQANGYLIKDYYIAGQLQMQGLSQSDTDDVFDGLVTWHYPNGTPSQTAIYKEGAANGDFITYDEQGKIKTKGRYSNGQPYEGSFETEYKDQGYTTFTFYEDSVLQRGTLFGSAPDKSKAKMEYYFENELLSKIDYYNQDGSYIGSATAFNENNGITAGYDIRYYYRPMMLATIAQVKDGLYVSPRKSFYTNGKVKMVEYFKAEGESTYEQPKIAESYFKPDGTRIDSLVYIDGSPTNGQQITFFEADKYATDADVIASITTYADGAQTGLSQTFHPNGKLASTANYLAGYPDGLYITYDENGKESGRVTYKDQSPWEGTLVSETYISVYKDGILLVDKELYPNKQIKKETKHNGEESITTWYTKDNKVAGTLKIDADYNYSGDDITLDDEGNLTAIRSYVNGAIAREKQFTDGKLLFDKTSNGTSTFYNPSTQKTYTCTYKDDAPQNGTMLEYEYDGTQVTAIRTYIDGQINGQSIDYSYNYDTETNDISLISNYKNGMLNGIQQVYKNGALICTRNYVDDALNGESIFYDENQAVLSKVNYMDGIPQNGKVYEYDEDNNIASALNYKNGNLNGESIYYEYGTLTRKEQYDNGIKTQATSYCSFLADTVLTLTYQNDEPYNGRSIEYNVLSEYKNGNLIQKTTYSDENDGAITMKEVFVDDKSTQFSYYADGTVKQKQTFVSETLNGEAVAYKPTGATLAQGTFAEGTPVSGSFACFNRYDETAYILVTIKGKSISATLYEDGKAKSNYSSSATDEEVSETDVFSNFWTMLSTQFSDYDFNQYAY
jgi:antitoxin component YwqK of YwqJK toxin-antitoxin module